MEPLYLEFDTLLEERYLIQGVIGEGGFAVVYEAQDQKLGQRVAVKVLTQDDMDSSAHKRFEREAHLAASLSHSDIVRVHDYGVTPQGAPFFVMEMLQGYTLDQHTWMHGAMEVERATRLIMRCVHALDTIHAEGVVHRDLKPSNLFLVHPGTSAESLTILDLGLGYLTDHMTSKITGDLTLLGTAGYLAPEYVEQRIVTPAMDVYQIGLVFLSLISGESPATGDREAWIEEALALLEPSLQGVIRQAVHTNHEARYAHAGEMLCAFEALETKPTQQPNHQEQKPLPWHLLIGGLIILCTGVLLVLVFTQDQAPPKHLPAAPLPKASHSSSLSSPPQTALPVVESKEPEPPLLSSQKPATTSPPDSDQQEVNAPQKAPEPQSTHKPKTQRTQKPSPSSSTRGPEKNKLDSELSKELEWLKSNR